MERIQENEMDFMDFEMAYGIVEESAERRTFKLCNNLKENEKNKNDFYSFEKVVLSETKNDSFLKMSFVKINGNEEIYYDFTGKIQLRKYISKTSLKHSIERSSQLYSKEALNILSNVLEAICKLENHFIVPNRIMITLDTIFINNNSEVSFAVIPDGKGHKNLQSKILELIEQIIGQYNNAEVQLSMENLKLQICRSNLSIRGIINAIGTMQREISYIQWNTNDFRNINENNGTETNGRSEKENIKKEDGIKDAGNNHKINILEIKNKSNMILIAILIFVFSGVLWKYTMI